MKAIVLSGGGARGAYQAGVLNAVGDISRSLNIQSPFQIYSGISAGAINAGFLASQAHDFPTATKALASLWENLHSEQVFKTDAVSLGKIGLKWVGELSFGGMTSFTHSKSLLDTSPLGDLIRNNLDFSGIRKNIQSGALHSLAITALDYKTSTSITFIEGQENLPMWERTRRKSELTSMKTEHILASSAIPLLFTPAKIDGRFYGDGCVRNSTTLSPAIHLGAEKLLVIGVRKQTQADQFTLSKTEEETLSVAKVVNVLLNSVLLDGIEVDVERLQKINEFLRRVPSEHHETLNFRPVDYVWVHPSEDIGAIAAAMSSKVPRVIRYLLKGLGPLDDAAEIISYLLFEPDFCRKLLEVGYQDGMANRDSIEEFLKS